MELRLTAESTMVTNDVTIKCIRILLLGRFIKGARTEMSPMLNSWPMVELGRMHHTLVQNIHL